MKYQVVKANNTQGYIIQEINPENQVINNYKFQDKTSDNYLHVPSILQETIGYKYIPLKDTKYGKGIISSVEELGYYEIKIKSLTERNYNKNNTNTEKVGTNTLYNYLTDDEKDIFNKLMQEAKTRYMKDKAQVIAKQKLEKAKLELEAAQAEYNKIMQSL